VALDAQASVVLAGRGQASALAVLVHGLHDPVDAGIVSDGTVLGVHHDDLEVLVGGVLVDPVRVEHAHVLGVAAGALLGNTADVAGELELVDTLVLGLTEDNALLVGSLAAASADGDAQDGVALLGLVAQLVRLVRAGRAGDLADLLGLTVLPGSVRMIRRRSK
jgi:hypothetical protein